MAFGVCVTLGLSQSRLGLYFNKLDLDQNLVGLDSL